MAVLAVNANPTYTATALLKPGTYDLTEELGHGQLAYRHWAYARAWVRCEVLGEGNLPGSQE